jgi:hypothetical protein
MAERASESSGLYKSIPQVNWRPWRSLTVASLALMDLSWILAWISILRGEQIQIAQNPAIFGLSVVLLTSYLVTRVTHTLKIESHARRVLVGITFVFFYLVLLHNLVYQPEGYSFANILGNINRSLRDLRSPIPVELSTVFLAAFLWYRGASLAMNWTGPRYVARTHRLGVFFFLLLGIVSLFNVIRINPLGILIVCFLFASLLAHSFARADTLEQLRGGFSTPFDWRWLLAIAMTALVIVFVALFTGDTIAVYLSQVAVFMMRVLVIVLLILSTIIASPLLLVLFLSFPFLQERLAAVPLLQNITAVMREAIQRIVQFFIDFSAFIGDVMIQLPDLRPVIPYLMWGMLIVAVVVFSLWFGRKWKTFTRKRIAYAGVDDRKGIPLSLTFLQSLLVESLETFSQRWGNLTSTRRWLGAVRIRVIYTRLMQLCRNLGMERRAVETPIEFMPRLRSLFPEEEDETQLITEAYLRVRYGELPESQDQIEQVERAWKRLKKRAKDLRYMQQLDQPK